MNISRAERLQLLEQHPDIDVLVVGAGINGIGTFWDLAFQGVKVLMVDRGDYCEGASAASSHMVHGGIRYLENGEFRLVREAVQERNRLIENAPHLVKPLPTTFPIFKWFSGLLNAPLKFLGLLNRPAERGAIVIKIGMTLYDAYTGKQGTVPRHVFRNRKESLKLFPDLNPEVIFTGTYYDGSMPSPERIAVELVRDAVAANPNATALNYVSFVSAEGDKAVLRDELTGNTYQVKPRLFVNAAGPWIDRVNLSAGETTRLIGGTKGSHLVLNHPELRRAIGENEFFFENKDGRIVLIFPLEDRVLIGTSDIRIEDPDQARITDEEVQYFFDMIKRVFPSIQVNRSHIVFTFSGVRPLPYTDASLTGQISRDHHIHVSPPGKGRAFPVYSLIGGKWTTFRAFAEKMADTALEVLGQPRRASTASFPIGGGKNYPKSPALVRAYLDELQKSSSIQPAQLETWFNRYGTGITDLVNYVKGKADQPLVHLPEMTVQEIHFLCEREDVIHLDDLILRRSLIGMLGRLTPALLDELAGIVGQCLGWHSEQVQQEKHRVMHLFQTNHLVDFNHYSKSP